MIIKITMKVIIIKIIIIIIIIYLNNSTAMRITHGAKFSQTEGVAALTGTSWSSTDVHLIMICLFVYLFLCCLFVCLFLPG